MPNLVLIDCHDLGQHLGCYGWRTVRSPNLDALAQQGVRFTNSFCTAPQCSPSRAALYTGRYPHATGMFGLAHPPFNWRMYAGEIHLARFLREAGYATTQIGTQHVTATTIAAVQELGFTQVLPAETAAEVAERAATFLLQSSHQPFFLNLGFFEPHRDARGAYSHAPPDESLGVQVPSYLPQSDAARKEFAALQGVIHALDTAIGVIWNALKQANLEQDTWLIFTTDHGLAMPRAKCTLYDAGIKTALMMRAPSLGIIGGRVYDALISNVDIVPTILEMLGLPIPARLHGASFAGLLLGRAYTPRSHIFAEKTFHIVYEPQRAIRTERYKLIWNAEAGIMHVPADIMQSPIYPEMIPEIVQKLPPVALYDLMLDSDERTNRCDDPHYAEIFQDLRARLVEWMHQTNDPLLEGPIASPFYHRGRERLMGTAV